MPLNNIDYLVNVAPLTRRVRDAVILGVSSYELREWKHASL